MKHLKYWIPAFLWAAFIFYMSSRSDARLPSFPYSDKIAHFGVYLIMGYLVAMGFARSTALPLRKIIIFATLIAFAYGLSDEFHQIYVPNRFAEIGDLLSDLFGGLVGSLLYGYKFQIQKRD